MTPRVLHVIVGHGLPTYFLNAVRSVRRLAPDDDLLVIDNASPDRGLRDELSRIAAADARVELILRDSNDLSRNGKVGELYDAYAQAFEWAIGRGYDLLHLLQADMQMLWWDEELVARTIELFASEPDCVNIHAIALPRDKLLSDDLAGTDPHEVMTLREYGLTDSGIYDLARWQELEMAFRESEGSHGAWYRSKGRVVICHPWPPDAQVPWPAVVRNGAVLGREVKPKEEFLLRPLSRAEIASVKREDRRTWLEDVCIPWGWGALTPMWPYGLESPDYWVFRYRDTLRNGFARALPRPDLRGLADRRFPRLRWLVDHRPSLFELCVRMPLREALASARRAVGPSLTRS